MELLSKIVSSFQQIRTERVVPKSKKKQITPSLNTRLPEPAKLLLHFRLDTLVQGRQVYGGIGSGVP